MGRPRRDKPNYVLRQPYNDVWYVCWTEAGNPKRRSTGCRDRGEAEAVLAGFLARLESPTEPEAKTIEAIMIGYLADRDGIVTDYKRLLEVSKCLIRHIGWARIEDMKPSTSKLYIRRRKDEGAGNGTIRRELSAMRAALNWAAGERWIERAPKVELPKAPPPRERWLTKDEANRLRAGCASPHIRLFVEIALNTGARKGAIGDLTWQQVDFERRLIDFNPPGRTQTVKRRPVVPINDTLLAALTEAAEIRSTEWVVEWKGDQAGNIKKSFERACKRAGLHDVTPHVLRHTAATWAAMAGEPMSKIARMLGHTNSAITEAVYAKYSPDYLLSTTGALE